MMEEKYLPTISTKAKINDASDKLRRRGASESAAVSVLAKISKSARCYEKKNVKMERETDLVSLAK